MTDLANLAQKAGLSYGVSGIIHPDDHLFRFFHNSSPSLGYSVDGYFAGGSGDADQVIGLTQKLALPAGAEVLEFAAGYGRVSRHLKRKAPHLRLVASDIHPAACLFIENEIGLPAIQSHTNPKAFHADRAFDFIFVLSLFSHLPEQTFGDWIDALTICLKPGGFLMFTTHGELAAAKQELLRNAVNKENGYGFLPVSDQSDLSVQDYGTAIAFPSFVIKQCLNHPLRVHSFTSGNWFGLQDEWIFRRGDK